MSVYKYKNLEGKEFEAANMKDILLCLDVALFFIFLSDIEQKGSFFRWLQENYPEKCKKVMNLMSLSDSTLKDLFPALFGEEELTEPYADALMSLLYFSGRVKDMDFLTPDALALLVKASMAGSGSADFCLGIAWRDSVGGIKKDMAKAFDYFQSGIARNNGRCINEMAYHYMLGQGVKVNFKEALRLGYLAAEQKIPSAFVLLGMLYQYGRAVQQDYAEAMRLYREAASLGSTDACNRIGYLYQLGLGCEQSYEETISWYKRSADAGDSVGANNLANLYLNGTGVKKDIQKAVRYYEMAADLGLAAAQASLGSLYAFGDEPGLERQPDKAEKLLLAAAEQGDAMSQFGLGMLYLEDGEKQDRNKAVGYLEKAAETGYAEAQFVLSQEYLNKDNSFYDREKGIKWLCSAADKGLDEAREALKRLGEE